MADSAPDLNPCPAPTALGVERLCRPCNSDDLPFANTDELEPLEQHLGQHRAVEALEFGLNMPHEGYHIFLLGSTGIGKRGLLGSVLDMDSAAVRDEVFDWCYVNNFEAPDKPLALRLPRGTGCELRVDMAHTVEELLATLPATFQSEEYQSRVQELAEVYQGRESDAFQALADKAKEAGVAMIQTPNGYTLAPMKDGEVITPKDFEAKPPEEQTRVMAVIETLKEELKVIVRQLPGWKKESRNQFKSLNQEFSKLAIDPVMNELKQKYRSHAEVICYLEAVHEDVMEEAEAFTRTTEESAIPDNLKNRVKEFPQYSVNVLVDNQSVSAAPVIYEDSPGFSNLVGRVEYVSQMGTLVTDFNLIKPGALHQANGGYLILDADKILTSPYAWMGLKRALKAGEVRIQSIEQLFSFGSTVQLQPEPIALDVKVVLAGDRSLYYLLQQYDPEFSTLFKVAADMAEDVPRSAQSTLAFARTIKSQLTRYALLPMDRSGVARVIEYAARWVEDSEKISVHEGRLSNLLTESDYRARQANAQIITREHVEAATAAAIRRLDQLREKSHEGILRDIMLVDTLGTATGQVNGLAVYLLGDYAFGRPTRITATARLGGGKILDIEREVDLGGQIHSKAVMIISALLANRYARNRPLPLSASLVFEQSYGGIEGGQRLGGGAGGPAFGAGGYPGAPGPGSYRLPESTWTGTGNRRALMKKSRVSLISATPAGSVAAREWVIPAANVVHLMLRQDVLDAASAGQFHIYSADNIDQALELLTGYTAVSIDQRVQTRLEELYELGREFALPKAGDKSEGKL